MFKRVIKLIERRYVYFPELALKGTPDHVGLEFQDLWLTTSDDVRINAWWIPGRAKTTVLFFHGNGGNVSARLDGFLQINRRLGLSILAVEYRGYGLSEGVPSEEGTYLDALAAREWLDGMVDGPLVYFGVSMGGAIAAWLATRRPPDALILESAPTSLPDVAHIHVPWTKILPTSLIMQTRYETSAYVSKLACPLLVIHGDADEEVPPECGRKIFEAAVGPKEFHSIPGGGHDRPDVVDETTYYAVLRKFLGRHVGLEPVVTGSS